jgi:hypothetical protein
MLNYEAYHETNKPVVREQLQKAGVRLASRYGVQKLTAKSPPKLAVRVNAGCPRSGGNPRDRPEYERLK